MKNLKHRWFIYRNFKISKFSARKVIIAIALVIAAIFGVGGCSSSSSTTPPPVPAQSAQAAAQAQDSQNLANNQPTPIFDWSQALQTLDNVETIEATGENTTSFGFANNGLLMWHCSSLGMPVPADAQLTSPDQIVADPNGGGYQENVGSLIMPQPDPIGYYTGDTTGTNTLCVGPGGKQYIQYWEGYTDAVSGPATYSVSTGVVLTGPPVPIKSVNIGSKYGKAGNGVVVTPTKK